MELNNLTESKILEAAEKVFYQKGKAGASMQDIADEAGITRTSLNYYFRSKDKLFESVFRMAMAKFIPAIAEMMSTDVSFNDYLPDMVNTIIDSLIENPQIPIFVLQELSSNTSRMPEIMKDLGLDPNIMRKNMEADEQFTKLPYDPRQIVINVISLCIFPFAARPVVQTLMYDGNDEEYIAAMQERKKIIPMMMKKLLNIS